MFEVISRPDYIAKRPWHCPNFISKLFGSLIPFIFPSIIRVFILKMIGVKIGRGVFVGRNCIIDDTFPELITIEDEVVISAGSTIFTHDASTKEEAVSPILIKKKAYLGTGCIILPGVTIGECSVVGAGAVVTKDVAPHTVVVGVPAQPIKRHAEPRFCKSKLGQK
jgi:acetyltransferase-like isoleucine patch superfamily enzyme